MPPSQIEKDIHNTLAYFAYSQYPLTIFEIYKWQYYPERIYEYCEIEDTLKNSEWLKIRASGYLGMYALGSFNEVEFQVKRRRRRFLSSVQKQDKMCKVVKYLSYLYEIKGIAICNTLSYHFARTKSDIDLFIITKKGYTWTARFCAVLPFMLLRQRPGETKKDPVDMSFFVSENSLNLSDFKMDEHDPYFAYWIKNLSPVYGDQKLWDRFFKENDWADKYLPNAHQTLRAHSASCKTRIKIPPCPVPEWCLKQMQMMKLPNRLKALANTNTCVVMSDDILKFHTVDRRGEIARAFKHKCI